MKEIIKSCSEHLDIAFDDFIYGNETYPILLKSESGNCDYCTEKSEYDLYLTVEEEKK